MGSLQPNPARLPREDGHHIAYHLTHGIGPGIIFLGGFMSDMTGTKATALEAWCRGEGRAFVRFDYLGHGASGGRFSDGTIGRWTDDAVAVIDQLTQGPQILVGSSMGGWIMLLAALCRPQRIAGLLGVATAADLTEELLWRRLDPAAQRQLQDEGVIHLPSDYPGEPYPITRTLIEEGRTHCLLGQTIALSCPVRLLHGMQDREVPWQISTRVADHLAGDDVRVTLVKDGDHRLSRNQDMDLLTGTLADLLAQFSRSEPRL
jgi:pimeloyl-ACP methyl ester carboxylesterase